MNKEEIKGRVRNFLSDVKKINEVSDDEDLFNAGLIDSLFGLQLVMFVEKEFSIKVPNKEIDIENFKSISNIAETVVRITESK